MENRFKFRFWNADTNKMIYNVYVGQESVIVPSNKNPMNMEACDFYNPRFVGKELMQCTGLSDKNGKLIFESDIVNLISTWGSGVNATGEVKWIKRFAKFVIYTPERDNPYCHIYNTRDVNDIESLNQFQLNIIGNIHQNPNLIKND